MIRSLPFDVWTKQTTRIITKEEVPVLLLLLCGAISHVNQWSSANGKPQSSASQAASLPSYRKRAPKILLLDLDNHPWNLFVLKEFRVNIRLYDISVPRFP